MVDPKPFAGFIEYTLKPITEDLLELAQYCKDANVDIHQLSKQAFRLYLIDKILSFLTALTVTGIICLTTYLVLSTFTT